MRGRDPMTKANAGDPPGTDEGSGPPVSWETLALARGRVARTMGWPEMTAAEWLRQQAMVYRVRVRFAPTWLPRTPDNLRRDGGRHAYPDRVLEGGTLSACEWRTP